MSAIEHDFAVRESPDPTDEEKLAALKFLGHWVGDIQQPLHAASQDDRGGNHIRTLGSLCESLHILWDSCIVEERLGMHPLATVRELRAGITDEQRAEWRASDPEHWANESFTIAREPRLQYCIMIDGTCQYAADNPEFDEGERERVVVANDGYLDIHAQIARERIAMAGVRLVGLIGRCVIRAPARMSKAGRLPLRRLGSASAVVLELLAAGVERQQLLEQPVVDGEGDHRSRGFIDERRLDPSGSIRFRKKARD